MLNSHYVLTAARCVRDYKLSQLSVVLNASSKDDSNSNRIEVARTILHPDAPRYGFLLNNDLALVQLRKPVNLTEFSPACLSNSAGKNNLYAIGAGKNYKRTKTLQRGLFEEVATKDCQRKWPFWALTNKHICAGGDGKATCLGDFGGPLMSNVNGTHYVVGVSSYGRCKGNVPSVFTRLVSVYIDWIMDKTKTVMESDGTEMETTKCVVEPPSLLYNVDISFE